jgi:hypothetical protein
MSLWTLLLKTHQKFSSSTSGAIQKVRSSSSLVTGVLHVKIWQPPIEPEDELKLTHTELFMSNNEPNKMCDPTLHFSNLIKTDNVDISYS